MISTSVEEKRFNSERKVQFGSITLRTNGFDRSIYEKAFTHRNIAGNSAHPANWSADALGDMLRDLNFPQSALPKKTQDSLFAADMTRLSEAEISSAHAALFQQQLALDAKYSFQESRGFFNDFLAAFQFVRNQVCTGINGWSKRSHSDLFVTGEGSAQVQLPCGLNCILSPDIWIEGMKHHETFAVSLKTPGQDEETLRKIVGHLTADKWSPDISIAPSYMTESGLIDGKLQEKTSIIGYELQHTVNGGQAYVPAPPFFHGSISLYGVLSGMEGFTNALLARLDEFFREKGTAADNTLSSS